MLPLKRLFTGPHAHVYQPSMPVYYASTVCFVSRADVMISPGPDFHIDQCIIQFEVVQTVYVSHQSVIAQLQLQSVDFQAQKSWIEQIEMRIHFGQQP